MKKELNALLSVGCQGGCFVSVDNSASMWNFCNQTRDITESLSTKQLHPNNDSWEDDHEIEQSS